MHVFRLGLDELFDTVSLSADEMEKLVDMRRRFVKNEVGCVLQIFSQTWSLTFAARTQI